MQRTSNKITLQTWGFTGSRGFDGCKKKEEKNLKKITVDFGTHLLLLMFLSVNHFVLHNFFFFLLKKIHQWENKIYI